MAAGGHCKKIDLKGRSLGDSEEKGSRVIDNLYTSPYLECYGGSQLRDIAKLRTIPQFLLSNNAHGLIYLTFLAIMNSGNKLRCEEQVDYAGDRSQSRHRAF